jgi:hypothetical protein
VRRLKRKEQIFLLYKNKAKVGCRQRKRTRRSKIKIMNDGIKKEELLNAIYR